MTTVGGPIPCSHLVATEKRQMPEKQVKGFLVVLCLRTPNPSCQPQPELAVASGLRRLVLVEQDVFQEIDQRVARRNLAACVCFLSTPTCDQGAKLVQSQAAFACKRSCRASKAANVGGTAFPTIADDKATGSGSVNVSGNPCSRAISLIENPRSASG